MEESYTIAILSCSPCVMSPIGVGASQPCSTIAQSLGVNVEESVLDWTNSLATPPRDASSYGGKHSVSVQLPYFFSYHVSSVKTCFISLNQPQISRSDLDRSRILGLFLKQKPISQQN